MFGLYGASTYSAISLYEKLFTYCDEHSLRLTHCQLPERLISDDWFYNTYRGNHVLFFDKADNFRRVLKTLRTLPVLAVVCDSPLALAQFSPVTYLDDGNIEREFSLANLSLSHFNSKLKQLYSFSGNHIEVATQKFDIIGNLLQKLENNVLHYYHTLTMIAVRPSNRHIVISFLLRRLFGEVTAQDCHNTIIPLLSAKYRDYFLNFENYLASDVGCNLLAALQEIHSEFIGKNLFNASNKEINTAISFDKLAIMYGIESYDLRYLVLAYCKTHRQKR